MQDNSTEKLKRQVLVPTEALRTPGEDFEICIYLSDDQELFGYDMWHGLRKYFVEHKTKIFHTVKNGGLFVPSLSISPLSLRARIRSCETTCKT